MISPIFDRQAQEPPSESIAIPTPERERQLDPAGYLADEALEDAVNVALSLGQPLLVTGEPGTGKTQLAYRIAWTLRLDVLRYDTKSTSTARDLFYSYDTLRRFHDANTKSGSQRNLDYVTYNALGVAILLSRDANDDQIKGVLPPAFKHPGRKRSVVLIDEVDKAPRDFPNDLLNEVENMTFRISELDNVQVTADNSLRPILILTSNSEKSLPDAFLRRCIYFHIAFPPKERLAQIIRRRVPTEESGNSMSPLLDSALDLFLRIRELDLRKPPSTAELINWIQALEGWKGVRPEHILKDIPRAVRGTYSTLVKTREDVEDLKRFLAGYLGQA